MCPRWDELRDIFGEGNGGNPALRGSTASEDNTVLESINSRIQQAAAAAEDTGDDESLREVRETEDTGAAAGSTS